MSVAAPAAQAPASKAAERPRWTYPHTLAILVLLAAISTVPILVPWAAGTSGAYHSARLAAWLITLGLMLAFVVVVGHGVTGGVWRGVLIDERNRISTSRLQLALWTAIILSAYLEAVLSNVGLHQVTPIHISVPQTLWAAMGISTISLAASPFILGHRTPDGALHGNPSPRDARWRDAVTGEVEGLEDMVDVGKLQMILVTIVLVLAYGIVLGVMFYTRGTRIGFLPKVDGAFTILLAISHGGYLLKKGVAKMPVDTSNAGSS